MNRHWRYNTVAGIFWRDRKIRGLSEDGRMLAIYFLTCEHRTTEGFYNLPRVLVIDDLRWNTGRFDAACMELADVGFARYDTNAEVVFITKGLKYNTPKGVNATKGAVTAIDTVQDAPDLFRLFLDAADHYAPAFAEAIRERYGLAHKHSA